MQQYSIFRDGPGRFYQTYDECMKLWEVPVEKLWVSTPFGQTYVIACGPTSGEPILLLHGMTFNSSMWFANIASLSKRYRVYCIDTPGDYGRSEVVRPLKNRQDCTDWMQSVLDALGLTEVHLIGHSMGGWLALNFALNCPLRVRSLVLLAPVVSFLRLPFAFMLKVYPVMVRPSRERIVRLWDWFLAKGSGMPPVVMEHIVEGWVRCRPQLRVVPNVYAKRELLSLKARTLFLVGDQEVVYNANKAVKKVRELLPQAEARVIPNASHCLVAEQPELVNAAVLHFLANGTDRPCGSEVSRVDERAPMKRKAEAQRMSDD